jgi:hypothetical protein
MNAMNQYDPYAIFKQQPSYDQGMTDLSGIQAPMQNTSAQQNMMQQNTSGMGQLANQAGQSAGGTNPMQAMANALRAGGKQQAGTGQMYDDFGRIVSDPTYGNISASSIMKNPSFNPYENPL